MTPVEGNPGQQAHLCFMVRHTARKITFIYCFSGNFAASVPVSTFMCLWAIYIFPGSVHIFPSSRIGRRILEILYINLSQIYECRNWETERYNSVLEIRVSFLGIHKWGQTFISDFHWPFICSVHTKKKANDFPVLSRDVIYQTRPERE